MKNLVSVVVLVSVLVSAAWSKEHPKKEKIIAFYKCVRCADDATIKEEYKKCSALKPQLVHSMREHCVKEVAGEAMDDDSFSKHICATDDGMEKMFDCMVSQKEKDEFQPTDEDQVKFDEFKACAMTLSAKYCKN